MSELLIAPSAPSVFSAPPPSGPPASKANETSASNGPQASANDSGKPAQEADAAPMPFAAVLKKYMSQAPASKNAKAAETRDPNAIAMAAASLELPLDETDTLTPLIAQLIPQLTQKAGSTDESTPLADGQQAALELAATPTAAPLTADVLVNPEAKLDTKGNAKLEGGVAQKAGQVGEKSINAEVVKPAEIATGQKDLPAENLIAAAAISADEGSNAAAAGSTKPTGDFAALVSHATEQLTATGHAAPTTTSRATTASDASMRMEHPVGHADWSNELGNKLSWMATAQRQQADLVLNPPQLGRVEISLTVNGDQATAVFASASAEVRELLEDSLPRLREILSGAGINLGEAEVGSESPNRFGTQDQKGENRLAAEAQLRGSEGIGAIALPGQHVTLAGRGMVDVFA